MNKVTKAKTHVDEYHSAEITESDPSSVKREEYSSGSDGSGHQTLERGYKKSRVKKSSEIWSEKSNHLTTHARLRRILSSNVERKIECEIESFGQSFNPISTGGVWPPYQTFYAARKRYVV